MFAMGEVKSYPAFSVVSSGVLTTFVRLIQQLSQVLSFIRATYKVYAGVVQSGKTP